MALSKAVCLLFAGIAVALPQGSPLPSESPSGLDCSWHLDHWDCSATCATITSTRLGIVATVTDYPSWLTSMNSAYSTSGVDFSGTRVFVHTSVYEYPGGSFTGYGVYDSHALTRAGYTVVEQDYVTTSCPPSTTFSLPPSPTGSICSPHQDHWHCDPITETPGPEPTFPPDGEPEPTLTSTEDDGSVIPQPTSHPPGSSSSSGSIVTSTATSTQNDDSSSATASISPTAWAPGDDPSDSLSRTAPTPPLPSHGGDDGHDDASTPPPEDAEPECEAQDSSWYCPPGVAEPDYPPGGSPGNHEEHNGGHTECTAHADRWDCPEGVPEPNYPPAGAETAGASRLYMGEKFVLVAVTFSSFFGIMLW